MKSLLLAASLLLSTPAFADVCPNGTKDEWIATVQNVNGDKVSRIISVDDSTVVQNIISTLVSQFGDPPFDPAAVTEIDVVFPKDADSYQGLLAFIDGKSCKLVSVSVPVTLLKKLFQDV